MDQPSTDQPSTDQPSTDQPSTDQPSTDQPSTGQPSPAELAHRLPHGVRPRRYDLVLEPDLHAATFAGHVRIEVDIEAPTNQIVLHALDLDLHSATVAAGDAEPVAATVALDPDLEFAKLEVPGALPVGPAVLEVTFDGVLNDQLVGFYRSTFRTEHDDGDTVEHTIAVTQFESTHARRAFPCFDEPAMKAVFALTVVADASLFVVSNGAEVERTELSDGRARTRFADTISMSTYLVALVVGPLEATEPRLVEGRDGLIELRVVYPPGNAHLTDFALDVADAALRYFEDYYDLAYPGDKVDLVAVPDFAFGAMENLGCITFREVLLLVDPDAATQPELQRIADVINHELAHMWFGDLVTMSWWNGIWLNEAFATFMEVMATDAFRPDWDVWTSFGLARAVAFDTDTLRSTRPIEYEVVTAADAEGMFDILTYEKGASVVRMLEQYLGAEAFRDGIRSYLRQHAYANTETTDLWDALEAATGEPVRRIMDAWILRGGYPVVHVAPSATGVTLTQRRASYLGEQDRADEPWPIPLLIDATTSGERSGTARPVLFDAATAEVDLGGPAGFVQANVAGTGFYRVELDPVLRPALAGDAGAEPLERFVLLDDAVAALLAGRMTARELMDLVERAARDEDDPSVWRRLAGACRELSRLAGGDHGDDVRALARRITADPLARLDEQLRTRRNDDPAHERRSEVRGVLVTLAGAVGEDPDVIARARQIFEDHPGAGDPADATTQGATTQGATAREEAAGEAARDDAGELDAALLASAVDVVAGTAEADLHAELERRWRAATTPQDELRHLNALVDTADPACFDRAVELALREVRTQNAPYLLRRAIAHPVLGERAWRTVSGAWDTVTDRFPDNSLPRMLEGIRGLSDPGVAREVESFVARHPVRSGERIVAQHIERMWVTVVAAGRVRAELGTGT